MFNLRLTRLYNVTARRPARHKRSRIAQYTHLIDRARLPQFGTFDRYGYCVCRWFSRDRRGVTGRTVTTISKRVFPTRFPRSVCDTFYGHAIGANRLCPLQPSAVEQRTQYNIIHVRTFIAFVTTRRPSDAHVTRNDPRAQRRQHRRR